MLDVNGKKMLVFMFFESIELDVSNYACAAPANQIIQKYTNQDQSQW